MQIFLGPNRIGPKKYLAHCYQRAVGVGARAEMPQSGGNDDPDDDVDVNENDDALAFKVRH